MTSTLPAPSVAAADILSIVEQELQSTPFIDVHTHLFQPSLGDLGLWGIDELITYHYLEAELFRSSKIRPAEYFALEKRQKADAIWQALFVENAPVSEATRGVVAVLKAFGLPTASSDLREARDFFASQNAGSAHRSRVRVGRYQRSRDDQRSARSGGSSPVGERRRARSAFSRRAAARSHI